jgi:hypothetical protein
MAFLHCVATSQWAPFDSFLSVFNQVLVKAMKLIDLANRNFLRRSCKNRVSRREGRNTKSNKMERGRGKKNMEKMD